VIIMLAVAAVGLIVSLVPRLRGTRPPVRSPVHER
jgi:hypothetical protein